MTRTLLSAVYVAGLAVAESLRLPRRLRRACSRERWRQPGGRKSRAERLVMAAVVAGIWLLPAVHILTGWLRPVDYSLPSWVAFPAIGVFALSLLLRWHGQTKLGLAWSPTVELADQHGLVTDGIYARIRHPIYASLILWAVAQPVLIQNLLAGWGGPIAVAMVWLIRVPAEERMMLERFGEEYEAYVRRTGRALPRIWRRRDYRP